MPQGIFCSSHNGANVIQRLCCVCMMAFVAGKAVCSPPLRDRKDGPPPQPHFARQHRRAPDAAGRRPPRAALEVLRHRHACGTGAGVGGSPPARVPHPLPLQPPQGRGQWKTVPRRMERHTARPETPSGGTHGSSGRLGGGGHTLAVDLLRRQGPDHRLHPCAQRFLQAERHFGQGSHGCREGWQWSL